MSSAKQWKEMLCFLKMDPKGSRYREKRMRPKMDHWGTPQESGATEEEYPPSLTEKLLAVRYD